MLLLIWRLKKNLDLEVDSSKTNPGEEWTYIEKFATSAFCNGIKHLSILLQKKVEILKLLIVKPRRKNPIGSQEGGPDEPGRERRSSDGRRRADHRHLLRVDVEEDEADRTRKR